MAGFIIVCGREERGPGISAEDVRRSAELIVPDNIEGHPPLHWEDGAVLVAAVNPGPRTLLRDGSVAVGYLNDPNGPWWEEGSPAPDGAYALCRVAERRIQLVTDLYASRSVWYALTGDAFLASTSQRALVALLGSFELNREAVSWTLSSGYLPPGAGWDRRLRRVPPACRLTLDRRRWTVEVARHTVPISPTAGTEEEHLGRLRGAMLDACSSLDLPWTTWRLALSGGLDSRLILVGLVSAGKEPTCVTWGLDAARRDPKNDAAVAQRVARRFGLPHVFYSTDFTGEPLDQVLGRFIAVSEGQLDQVDAYLDGLLMWKRLFEAGVEGIVRGDEPSQGYRWYYYAEGTCRLRAQAQMIADYPATHPIHRLELAPQSWPPGLRRLPGESLSAYSGRLFQDFMSPAMLSPLNDMKGAYLEIANPLLSRQVVVASHGLPESLRRGRRAMKAVHASLNLGIPPAERSAPAGRETYFAHPGFRDELRRGLWSPAAEGVFSEEAVTILEACLREGRSASLWARARPRVKEAVPKRLSGRLKPRPQLTGQGSRLAWRAYIVVRMAELLQRDAALLWQGGGVTGSGPVSRPAPLPRQTPANG